MAAGRPVLALDGGGLGEVARDAYGARAFADAPDVADRIAAELVWLNTDREELEMRSDQARAAWAALFSAEAMAQAVEQFYESVLTRAGAER
jgi:glycosyltransferase involved in cell wall biosynthesis